MADPYVIREHLHGRQSGESMSGKEWDSYVADNYRVVRISTPLGGEVVQEYWQGSLFQTSIEHLRKEDSWFTTLVGVVLGGVIGYVVYSWAAWSYYAASLLAIVRDDPIVPGFWGGWILGAGAAAQTEMGPLLSRGKETLEVIDAVWAEISAFGEALQDPFWNMSPLRYTLWRLLGQ